MLALGGLILTAGAATDPWTRNRLIPAVRPLLIPLGLTIAGVLAGKQWGRWLGLAAGLAVLPWAAALVFGPTYGHPITRQLVALLSALVLLLSLTGKRMFEVYEGPSQPDDRNRRKMAVVRWTIIVNLASVLALYFFVIVYQHAVGWHVLIPASLLLGLLAGVFLLGAQKSVGILIVALCCISFVPAGGYFVWKEATYVGEAVLFAAVFLPGVLMGWVCLFAFGQPMLAMLRSDP